MQPLLPEMIEVSGFPITLAFFNHRVFFSERITGNLWEITGQDFRLINSFPIVKITGHHETGLLGIAVDPDFGTNQYLYAYYTYGNQKSFYNKVVRIKTDNPQEEILLDALPAGLIHNGGILAFASDKTLYIGIGVDNPVKEKSQKIEFLGGKILRINPDGTIPEDNPFPNSPVFSLGHRNIFGLAFHPQTGKLYVSDVGPDRNDEINIIEKGGNYGWPEVTGKALNPKYIDPLISYTPTITPTQSVFVGNNLYFGSYNEGTVHKLTLSGKDFDQVSKDEIVYRGRSFGVIGVFYGPDEQFYLTTPNKIVRFTPAQT
ncbi:MAG: PQQ-dependent sugar dehydrogenase [Patescibacteria group bacterium]|nr:PQQ-dependent sugar dehydrogenase [Patescibacteria group bacterium]